MKHSKRLVAKKKINLNKRRKHIFWKSEKEYQKDKMP